MRNKGTHSVTFKKKISKTNGLFRAYSQLQLSYGERLDTNDEVIDIKANVRIDIPEQGKEYTTDFVCIKRNGELMVRECVMKKSLLKPSTIKMLDISFKYWSDRGVKDWGIVLDGESVI